MAHHNAGTPSIDQYTEDFVGTNRREQHLSHRILRSAAARKHQLQTARRHARQTTLLMRHNLLEMFVEVLLT